jgi:hypothetical protein
LSRARGATFFFSSPADLVNAQGFATQTSGEATSSFSMPRFAVFIQDEWSLNSRLRILLGARYDIEVPPIDDVVVNEEFLTISGIRADSNLTRRGRVSPRFEFEWRPDLEGRWSLRGTAGIWDMPMDPTLVGEVLANHGVVRVSRNFGTFTSWPDATDTTGARALTLPAPGFQGARSKRGMLTLTRQFTPGVQLSLAGTYRRTDFLPVRRDLNRLAVSAGVDQHGRPLFGALQQQGSLIRAQNESNRRFPQFDIVSALGVDGWSEYIAGSAALQVQLSNRVFLHGNYTYSQTEDNWFMARESGFADAISPFSSTGEFAEWTTGVSDFDVPHRAVLGAEITLPMLQGLRIAGLYRYQSGYPFTPGFRAGVDANADGSARNDPAFIDLDMAGLNELTDEWPCLRTSAGTFAERNSCRAPAASFLDARVAVGLLSSRGRSVEIVIDALNLVSSGRAEIDRSLFLIDPTGTLTTDANGTVNVPLLVNHNFGEPLLRAAAERALRVGARVRF